MNENVGKVVRQRVERKLARFGQMNPHDPIVVVAMSSDVLMELAEIQDQYGYFDGDIEFDYDPEPYMNVKWWMNDNPDDVNTLKVRFDPIRVEDDQTELYDAYERAKRVL